MAPGSIGLITGPLNWWEAREREAGWRETTASSAFGDTAGPVFEGDWTAASGEEGLHRLLAASPGMDAVFASNDQMALGVLHAAHTLGRRVPEDLSVVGVDNIPEGSHFWPPLTTVHQPLGDAGVLAVEGVDDAIRRLGLRRTVPECAGASDDPAAAEAHRARRAADPSPDPPDSRLIDPGPAGRRLTRGPRPSDARSAAGFEPWPQADGRWKHSWSPSAQDSPRRPARACCRSTRHSWPT